MRKDAQSQRTTVSKISMRGSDQQGYCLSDIGQICGPIPEKRIPELNKHAMDLLHGNTPVVIHCSRS